MRNESLEFLKTLLETPSPSGFETQGQRIWADYTQTFAEKIRSDPYGNVYASINPDSTPKILLSGHADELGLMVTYIDDNGFVYFKGIGGVDRSMLRGQRVVIHTPQGAVPGVIGHLAIHMQEPDDRKKLPEFHEAFIDIGARSKDEASKLVTVGNAITHDAGVVQLAGNRIAARGCDNRIGTWAAAETLRLLAEDKSSLSAGVVAVSTIQEENGLYGATMAGYRAQPDVALVIDVTHATDIPPCKKPKHGDIKLGGGPVLSIGSSNHPILIQRLQAAAWDANIPIQLEANPRYTGTDADAIFLQHGGIPTVSIGLPNRYMHSPVEVIELSDLQAIAELLAAFCRSVQPDDSFSVEI